MLPVASAAQVRRYVLRLVRRYPGALGGVLGLHALAATAGLAMPWLVGRLVEAVKQGSPAAAVDQIVAAILACVLAQAVLLRFASFASGRLGERVLAQLREEFVDRVLAIPLSTVEQAGTGDLLARVSRDVDALSRSVRRAVPEILLALVMVAFTVGAVLLVGPALAVPVLLGVPVLWIGTRWYLRQAPRAYLAENAAWSRLVDGLAETAEGARTVEMLGTQRRRRRRTDDDIRGSYRAERYTLRLRTIYFPAMEIGYLLPVAGALVLGGWYYHHGWATLGEVTAATLYMQQLIGPVEELLSWLDEVQVGAASLARLIGVAQAPDDPSADDPSADDRNPHSIEMVATGVRYSYRDGRDVLRGIDLTVRQGERLAVVGPSGAGKSTLGRLLAGVHSPRTGSVTVGGVPLVELPLPRLRAQVALVTQEHHIFLGTLRENLTLARPDATDDEVRAALATVDALSWVSALPRGLDTPLGADHDSLSAARAQQVALARLVLAGPHTLVLDEATSLIDPRAARQLERSLAAVLHGRTVIAIAHRLFSAHDADRVAVVENGRISELGRHAELVAAGGAYAALWRSWHGDQPVGPEPPAPVPTGAGVTRAGGAGRSGQGEAQDPVVGVGG